MKSLFVLLITALLTNPAMAQLSDLINPENSPEQKQQLMDLEVIQEKIAEGEKIKVGHGADFQFTIIVTFARELPSEPKLNPELHEAVQHTFMFVSSNHRWLCEFRINGIWQHSPKKLLLLDELEEPSGFKCYPRM